MGRFLGGTRESLYGGGRAAYAKELTKGFHLQKVLEKRGGKAFTGGGTPCTG